MCWSGVHPRIQFFMVGIMAHRSFRGCVQSIQRESNLEVDNPTDSRLCFDTSSCSAEIKPRGESEWALGSCFQGIEREVRIYSVSGPEIYNRWARCEEWGDAFIVINWRDGEFIVADSINARTSPP